MTCYLTAIVIFTLIVMACEIITRTFELLSIRIFDLNIEGEDHEEQCCVLCRYMSNCIAYNLQKKMKFYLKPFVHHQIVHAYIISAMPC